MMSRVSPSSSTALSENCGVMPRDMQSERTNNSEAADKNKDKGSESKEK